MKTFTEQDVNVSGKFPTIYTSSYRQELVSAPLNWQKIGLQETATGYGSRLNTGLKINFCGKLYRVYCTCYSNSGSFWFTVKGRKIWVS